MNATKHASLAGALFSFGFALHLVGCVASGAATVDPGTPGKASTAGAPDATQFCGTFCSRSVGCDGARDEQTCQNACENQNAAIFPKLRADVVGLLEDCLTAKDCKTVLSSDVIATCQGEAVASVAPSSAAVALCDALDASQTKCGRGAQKAACLDTAKLYNDATLTGAAECSKKACADVDACVGAALGGLGTGTSVPDAGPPEKDAGSTTCGFAQASTCTSCVTTSCKNQLTACEYDTTCQSYLSCWSACTTTTCTTQCEAHDPQDPVRLELASCLASACCAACAE